MTAVLVGLATPAGATTIARVDTAADGTATCTPIEADDPLAAGRSFSSGRHQ